MYRTKLKIWIFGFIIITFINLISNIDASDLILKKSNIPVTIHTDVNLKTTFLNQNFNILSFYEDTSNPIIKITSTSNKTIDGYKKVSDAIYTPVVAIVPAHAKVPSSVVYNMGSDVKYGNLQYILNAIIDNKTLEDLDISFEANYKKDSNIILNIPSKGTYYYDVIIEQIYICLNNNIVPNDEERERLKPLVDNLLAKSKECNDVDETIYNDDSNTFNIYLTLESLTRNGQHYTYQNYSSSGYGHILYFEKSSVLAYDVFVKEEVPEEYSLIFENFENNVLKNKNFSSKSGYRTLFSLNYNEIFKAENPNIINMAK